MPDTKHKFNHIGLLLLLAPILISCRPVPPSEESIVGRWVEPIKNCQSRGADVCASIEFFTDGRFEAINAPRSLFLQVNQSGVTNLDGYWELGPPLGGKFDPYTIRLYVAPDGHLTKIYLTYNAQGLFMPIDNLLYFSKQEK